MQQVSLPWLVLILGGTPLQVGLAVALQFGPEMLLSPLAGVFADRLDKRRLLIATQFLAMLPPAIVFVLAVSGAIQLPHVFVLALGFGVVNAIDMPVRQSLVPDLVPRDAVSNAVALNSMAFNVARMVGPALAGALIAVGSAAFASSVAGVAMAFGVNAVAYSSLLGALLLMDPHAIRRIERPAHHPRVMRSLADGVSYALRTPHVLWPLVLLGGIAAFGLNFQILLPLWSRNVLGLDADGYGALFASMGIGSLFGSLTLAFMRRRRALPLMAGGGILLGALEVVLGLIRNAWLAYPLMVGVGYFAVLMINTITATVHANVTDQVRSRVMALYVMVFAIGAPLGGLFAGGVAEIWGASLGFVVGGLLSAFVTVLVAWRLRHAAVPVVAG